MTTALFSIPPDDLAVLAGAFTLDDDWYDDALSIAGSLNGGKTTDMPKAKPWRDIYTYVSMSEDPVEGLGKYLAEQPPPLYRAISAAISGAFSHILKPHAATIGTRKKTGNLLLDAPIDHEGHAQCVLDRAGDKIAYCNAYGWLWYNGTHWEQETAEAKVTEAVIKALRARRLAQYRSKQQNEPLVRATACTSRNVNGVMNLLKAMTTVSVSVFDQHPDHVNALNGVIDLKTGQLLDHNPAWYFTYTMQANYNPAAPYSEWLQFLNGVTDPETVTFLKTAMGYSLTGHTREEKMFYIFGPTRSGKGTFTETLMTLLGKEPLCTETSFETFTADRSGDTQNFDLAPLKPCRVVFASESNKYQSLNPAVVKRLTGGNDIRCAFKRKDHFTYRPQFKLWLSSNEPVHADPDDDAAWARLIVVTFPNSFLGQEDTTLKQRLKEPTALEGALRWCVEGAQEWYANGLQQPVAIVQETKRHRDEQDYVQQFIDECCSVSPAHFVSNADLYPAYVQFMNDEIGLRPKSKRYLNRTLKKKGFILDHNTAKTKRGVWGISLKP